MARSGKPLAGLVHSKCRWCWLRSCWICSTRRLVLSLGNNRVVTLRWNCASLLIKTSTAVASYIEIIIVFLQYKQRAEAALTVCQRCRKDNRLLIIFRDDISLTSLLLEIRLKSCSPRLNHCTICAPAELSPQIRKRPRGSNISTTSLTEQRQPCAACTRMHMHVDCALARMRCQLDSVKGRAVFASLRRPSEFYHNVESNLRLSETSCYCVKRDEISPNQYIIFFLWCCCLISHQ